MDVQTQNDFLISGNGARLFALVPVNCTTKQQAYRTAAWLRLMAFALPDEEPASTYEEVEYAIANT